MGVPQALPPGLILRGAVSVQPGAFEKLASIASHVRPLVESGAVRGFFLGDEQCGNSSCACGPCVRKRVRGAPAV